MYEANINNLTGRKCAFCKNWYDVTNSAITPKNPKAGVWGFDGNAKMKCLRKNVSTKAIESCAHFQCKL